MGELKDLTALQILMGEPNDEAVTYTKTSALQVSSILDVRAGPLGLLPFEVVMNGVMPVRRCRQWTQLT